jgi:hypothetical protein
MKDLIKNHSTVEAVEQLEEKQIDLDVVIGLPAKEHCPPNNELGLSNCARSGVVPSTVIYSLFCEDTTSHILKHIRCGNRSLLTVTG